MSRLSGHVPRLIARSQHLGRHSPETRMQIAVALSPANPAELTAAIAHLYAPGDPLYHQFLTPTQFVQSYAPSASDFNQVIQYFTARGLTLVKAHPNRLVVDLEGASSDIESALQLEIHDYLAPDGRTVFAPTTEPLIADEVASKLTSIVGLSSFGVRRTHLRRQSAQSNAGSTGSSSVNPGSYVTPSKIKSAYGLSSTSETGAGETIGVFELDGYTASDISSYATYFGLTQPSLKNVLVNGATGTPGSGADEVTLDIELAMAMAPGASDIMVYEAPNTDAGVLDGYTRIASDNLAKEISTSWGESELETEGSSGTSTLNAENTIFQEMAVQGQSIFASAGDSGAYDDPDKPTTLAVDDPGSQPYVVSVGGTTLTLTNSNTYGSESSWNIPASSSNGDTASGGGGGISAVWSIPTWQQGLGTTANKGSTTMRMVPDVSLEANQNVGYSIYFDGQWIIVGGTSCSAPLWAGFAALINQARVASGLTRMGYPNPLLYQLGESANYSSLFHDIADGSTNMYYPAVTGYDLTTGWGSFIGSALIQAALTEGTIPGPPTNIVITVVQ